MMGVMDALPIGSRRLASRVILMPQDTNEAGSIFAGIILSYLDLAGAVEAEQYAPDLPELGLRQPFVTAAMPAATETLSEPTAPRGPSRASAVQTRRTARPRPLSSDPSTSTVRLGRTSVTVRVEVEAQRAGDPSQIVRVTEALVTYVAIDQDHRPTPIRHSGGRA